MDCRYECKDNGRTCCNECEKEECAICCDKPCYLITGEKKPVFILPE